jgi:large subunit ribosomal protein L23
MLTIERIIKKPLLTEKSTRETEVNNRYGFVVDMQASKHQIKDAVETLFDVKVSKVWTSVTPGKMKRFGRYSKKTAPVKKAYVQTEQGQKIEFYKGL